MSDVTATATPAPVTAAAEAAVPDAPIKTAKEISREQWQKEIQETNARAEREKAEASSRKPKAERPTATVDNEDDDASDEPKPETPAERKMRLKVNGKDLELTEAEVIKRAQLFESSNEKFQKASQVQKQAESFIRALKENPKAVLSHPALGVNLEEFAEQIVWERMQERMVPPEERERQAERQELERYREEKRLAKEQARQQQNEQLKEKYTQDWSAKFHQALDSGGLPKTDWTVTRMATYMRQALAQGHKHIQPADVVEMVREDWTNAQRQMFSHLDGDKLVALLGDEAAEKLRKHDLSKFGGDRQQARLQQPVEQDTGVTYSSTSEMLDALRRSRKG